MRTHFVLAAAAVVSCCAAFGEASVLPTDLERGESPAVLGDVPKGETRAALVKRDEGEDDDEDDDDDDDEPLEVTNMAYMSPLSFDAAGAFTPSGGPAAAPAARLRKRSDAVLDAQWKHGVASGDPLHDAVIVWTKVTLPETVPPTPYVTVRYDVSKSPDFTDIVARGAVGTGPEVDYIVKADVTGLEARTEYFYRFSVLGSQHFSPVGKTRTFPRPDDASVNEVDLIFASCANMPFGYFNAYRMISQRKAEAVVFLGDYYYEYQDGFYGEGALLDESRIPQPNKELKTLADYRARHSQYKTDWDLQDAHAAHPWIVIWDDHEFGDNAYNEGSENHKTEIDGAWSVRRDAAMQAYFEYMPIRQGRMDMSQKIYRSFAYGTLFDLIMLDTRMDDRDQPGAEGLEKEAADRTMLGPTQVQWLKDQLTNSTARGAPWRLIGNQVLFSEVIGLKEDTWSNYPAERQQVMDHLASDKVDNTVFLTGDVHISLAMDVTPHVYNPLKYHPWSGKGSVAVEFVTPAITAMSIENKIAAAIGGGAYRLTHPHIQYADLNRKGYCAITISRDRVVNSWYHLESLQRNDYRETLGKQMQVLLGENRIDQSKRKQEKLAKRSPTVEL